MVVDILLYIDTRSTIYCKLIGGTYAYLFTSFTSAAENLIVVIDNILKQGILINAKTCYRHYFTVLLSEEKLQFIRKNFFLKKFFPAYFC